MNNLCLETCEMWFSAAGTSGHFGFFCRFILHLLFSPAQEIIDRSFTANRAFWILFGGKILDVSFFTIKFMNANFFHIFELSQFVNSTYCTATYSVHGILNSSSLSWSITFLVNLNATVIHLFIVRHFTLTLLTTPLHLCI